jgi:amino acid transporter
MLAADRFFPRQFVNLGDRLVYSNGIIVLSVLASLLIWALHADVNSLIHLYVIGVFTAFTISQAGMVRYWRRRQDPGWQRRLAVNAVGAAATGVVLLIVIYTKFMGGAWMVTIAIPAFVGSFYGINRHTGGRRGGSVPAPRQSRHSRTDTSRATTTALFAGCRRRTSPSSRARPGRSARRSVSTRPSPSSPPPRAFFCLQQSSNSSSAS